MNSSEYHKCMSEVYFTRALLFMLWCIVATTSNQSMLTHIVAGVMALNCFAHLYLYYREFREANDD